MADVSRRVHNHGPRFGPQACPESLVGECVWGAIEGAHNRLMQASVMHWQAGNKVVANEFEDEARRLAVLLGYADEKPQPQSCPTCGGEKNHRPGCQDTWAAFEEMGG